MPASDLPFPTDAAFDADDRELTVVAETTGYDTDDLHVRSSPEHIVINADVTSQGCFHPPDGLVIKSVSSVELRNSVLTVTATVTEPENVPDPMAPEIDHDISVASA